MSYSIEVKNLVKRYAKASTNSVDDISFYVESGSFFSLLGPNGAGKTTTISILTSLLQKTSGEVLVAGYDVSTQPNQVRQNIGVIFQNPSLDLNLTAEENIRFHANLYNLFPYRPLFSLMPDAYRRKVHQLAEVLDLTKAIHQPVKELSGGMKRKLEIIRSLMHSPRILFLDEPTTGLDPVSRKNLWQYLNDIRKEQDITIFLTTHYLEEAENSDYVCIINNGIIQAKGSPTQLKQQLLQNSITIDTQNRSRLKKELDSLPKAYKYTGSGPFHIYFTDRTAQAAINHIKTPLTHLDITIPSLEDAYVKLLSKSGSTNDLSE